MSGNSSSAASPDLRPKARHEREQPQGVRKLRHISGPLRTNGTRRQ